MFRSWNVSDPILAMGSLFRNGNEALTANWPMEAQVLRCDLLINGEHGVIKLCQRKGMNAFIAENDARLKAKD
jgi:hypothetical protein